MDENTASLQVNSSTQKQEIAMTSVFEFVNVECKKEKEWVSIQFLNQISIKNEVYCYV